MGVSTAMRLRTGARNQKLPSGSVTIPVGFGGDVFAGWGIGYCCTRYGPLLDTGAGRGLYPLLSLPYANNLGPAGTICRPCPQATPGDAVVRGSCAEAAPY